MCSEKQVFELLHFRLRTLVKVNYGNFDEYLNDGIQIYNVPRTINILSVIEQRFWLEQKFCDILNILLKISMKINIPVFRIKIDRFIKQNQRPI